MVDKPPYEGREEEGARVGRIRTSIAAAMWTDAGITPDELLDRLQAVVDRYRDDKIADASALA